MRVFLDTNVLASAISTRGICADVLHVTLAEHRLVVGEKVLSELRRGLARKFRAPSDVVDEADEFLRSEGEVVRTAPKLEVRVRNPDDLVVLEQAVAGSADVLVTGDRDLLEIGPDAPLRIMSPRAFWDLLRKTPPRPEEEVPPLG